MKKFYFLISLIFSFVCFSQTISLQNFASGFTSPIELVNAGDNRLFVVQQNGIIRIVQPDGSINATDFLNISTKIIYGGERGLLGLAFHPQYATNGKFYVYYNATTTGNITVAKYTVSTSNPDVANASSEEVLLNIPKPFSNHNGGCIKFAPDGNLWISTGDGGSGGDPNNYSQNTNSFLGKMLRINVDGSNGYTIPADNPFAGATVGLDEIWSYGLRNAWKFSFDTTNNNVLIADVGQGNYEEINRMSVSTAGINYGWRCYEGNNTYNTSGCAASSTMTFPIVAYNHSSGRCSVTGGYVYRGSTYVDLQGKYVFTDYCIPQIGYLNSIDQIIWSSNFSGNSFSSFGEDINKELYVVSISGTIYKLKTNYLSTSENEIIEYRLYPNPTKEKLFLSGLKENNLEIEFFSLEGKLIKKSSFSSDNSLDVSFLEKGNYFINVLQNNQKVFSQKIIKE